MGKPAKPRGVIPVEDDVEVAPAAPPQPEPGSEDDREHVVTWRQYAWYRFDLWIAKRQSQLMALTLAALLQIFGGGLLIALGPVFNGDPAAAWARLAGETRFSIFWMSWSFLVNPGNHVGINGAWERTIGVTLTVLGVLYMATVIGLVVDTIREKLDRLKVGKAVLERGHTVILGWSDRAPLILAELILANESENGGVVVILAEAPSKEAIEAEVLHRFRGRLLGTRVVVRTGSPMLLQDLDKVAVEHARATIVLSETGGDADKSDALSLRKVLTVKSLQKLAGFALVEIRDVDNEPLVKLVGGDAIETLVSHDIIGRMMLMASRNPGLSRVYSEVLGFDGDEFYMGAFEEIVGLSFGELQQVFPDAIPIGLASNNEAQIWLKPSLGRVVRPGEKVIVIAEDDDTYAPAPPCVVKSGTLPAPQRHTRKPELILFCGWRRDIRDILLHLDHLVMAGSRIHMCTDAIPLHERDLTLAAEGLHVAELQNLRIEHFNLNTSVRRRLEDLPLEEYTSIMVFPDQAHEEDMMHSDSHAISTLLLIRDIQQKRTEAMVQNVALISRKSAGLISRGIEKWRKQIGEQRCPMICEILDPRTQATVESNTSVAGSSDFMQSNRLIAQVLSMISENRGVKLLLDELLSPLGAGFHVAPAREYVAKHETLSFYDLAARCLECKRDVLLGYQDSTDLTTVINPRDKAQLKVWDDKDLVVLTGDSRLVGQDRGRVHAVLDAMMARGVDDKDAKQHKSKAGTHADTTEDRIARAKRHSDVSAVTATLSKTLGKMKTEDLQWLHSRVQDEIRTRDMKHVAPLALPLDPSLQGLIDDLAKPRKDDVS